MRAPRLLVVTRHTPLPGRDGASAYLFDLLHHLASRGVRIELVWIKADGALVNRGWWRVPSEIAAVAQLSIVGSLAVGPYRLFWWGPFKAQILGVFKNLLVGLGLWRRWRTAEQLRHDEPFNTCAEPGWSDLPSVNEARFFRARLQRFRPDAVLANYCWLSPLFPTGPVRKLVLTNDVVSHRLNLGNHHPRKAVQGQLSPATPEGEARLLDAADVILAISEDDAAIFRGMLPEKPVLLVPKAARVQTLAGASVTGRCLFVGSLNPPNRQGLAWLLELVWPRVLRENPGAVLHVCGAICDDFAGRSVAGVVFRGRVGDLHSEYAAAEVVLIPLLEGSGIKIKLVEAAGLGRACVTTSVGLQGLPFLRDAVLEANGSDDFACAILRLLADPALRIRLQQDAIAAVTTQLAPDACYDPVYDAIREGASTPSPAIRRRSVRAGQQPASP